MSGGATTTMLYIWNHPEKARKALLAVNQCKPRIVALAEALGRGAQVLEDPVFDFITSWNVDSVSGDGLDKFGSIVGEPRQGLEDVDYRRFIKARMRANVSRGTRDEIIEIFALLMSANDVRYFDLPPAAFAIQAERATWLDDTTAARVSAFMRDIKPAGVGMSLIEAAPNAFTYDAGPGYDDGLYSRYI